MAQFQEYYGYSFLDELHNFFPDFLYNNQRFTSVTDVFAYLNQQMGQNFNLYSTARGRHGLSRRGAAPIQAQAQAQAQAPSVPYFDDMNYINNNNNNNNINNNIIPSIYTPQPTAASTIHQRVAQGVSVVPQAVPRRTTAAPAVDLFSTEFVIREPLGTGDIAGIAGLASLLMPGGVQPRNLLDLFTQIPGFSDPVIVRPSANDIAAATTLQTQVASQGEICAICQDEIIINCQTRKINHCDHKFHKGCIDTWFAQNVHCPVCRHDIRSAPDDDEEDENENIVD